VTLARRLAWLGATLVALEILYLIAGNLFLRFALRSVVSSSPDRTMIDYASAYTTLPGVAHVRAFRMRAQDAATQWQVEVDEADVTIELWDLVHRTFHASRVRAKGVRFRLRRKLTDEGAKAPRATFVPPIAGFDDPPLRPIGPPEDPETTHAGWTAALEDITASLTEVWVDEWQLGGPATLRGSFFKSARKLQVGPATLEASSAEARVGGEPSLIAIETRVDAVVGVIDMRDPIARSAHAISVRGSLRARVPSVDFVRVYLGVPPVVALAEGGGPLDVVLDLRDGLAMPPSRLTFESARLLLAKGGFAVDSSFALAVRVEHGDGAPLGSADLRVRKATLTHAAHRGEPPVVEDARIHFSGLPVELAAPLAIEHATLDLPARLPDLGWILPRRSGAGPGSFDLAGAATGRVRADFDGRLSASGTVEAHADRAALKTRTMDVSTEVTTELSFRDAWYETRSLLLTRGDVRATKVSITRDGRTHRDGTARVEVTAGRVERGVPRDLALAVSASHPDLSWIAYASDKAGIRATAGELAATLLVPYPASLLDGSAAEAAVTGTIDASASGVAHYRDTQLGFRVRTKAVIDALDLGRRSLRLSAVHVTARDVSIDRGSSHTRGWWGDFDTARFTSDDKDSMRLAASIDTRCQSGALANAILASAGIVPAWVGAIFPMNDLRVVGNVNLDRGAVDFALRAQGSSATVTADLKHANKAASGVVLVQTSLLSVGVDFGQGKSHVKFFAGETWLDERIRDVELAGSSRPTIAPSGRDP
jgi:hypothetical protein